MRNIFVIVILTLGTWVHGQPLPDSWIGTYQGTMELYGKESTPFAKVLVCLSLREIKKDSLWTYYMTYGEKDKPGYLEKNYHIVLNSDGLALDEGGGVIIPMRLFGNCLMDFYTVEDSDNSTSYMSSLLCRQEHGELEFTLFGGSLEPIKSTQIVEESDHTFFGLNVYALGFNQHVVLNKITK